MTDVVLIVEGHGDVNAFPSIAAKIGVWLGTPIICANPIRSGGWDRIRKPGGLERLVKLAASRPNCRKVLIVVDLDDGCPIAARQSIFGRIGALVDAHGIDIELCFCIREFEAWILAVVDHIAASLPEYGWVTTAPVDGAATIRDAKGRLRECMTEGYGESGDQGVLGKAIPPAILYQRDRSFKRFVKALTGLDYDILAAA